MLWIFTKLLHFKDITVPAKLQKCPFTSQNIVLFKINNNNKLIIN